MGFDAWFFARLDYQDKDKRMEEKHKQKPLPNENDQIQKIINDEPLHKAISMIKYIMKAKGTEICNEVFQLKR